MNTSGYVFGDSTVPASLRKAIDDGQLAWAMEQMKRGPEDQEGCNEFQRVLLEDLQMRKQTLRRG